MRKTTKTLFGVLSLGLLAAQGCNEGSVQPGIEIPEGFDNETAPEHITLTKNDPKGILGRLAQRHETLEVSDLLQADEDVLRAELAGASVVSVDLAELDASASTPDLRRVAQVAEQVGAGLLMTNVQDEQMVDIVGVGLNGLAVYVPPGGVGRKRIVLVPDPADDHIEVESSEGTGPYSTDLASLLGVNSDALKKLRVEQATDTLDGVLTAQPAIVAKSIFQLDALPQEIYQTYYIDVENVTWHPVYEDLAPTLLFLPDFLRDALINAQTSSSSMDFEVDMVSTANGQGKFVAVRPRGTSFHPGAMLSNTDRSRGYFNYLVNGAVGAADASILQHYAHSPTTTQASGTFTRTTGYSASVGASKDGPSVGFGYEASTQATTSIQDFGVVDNSRDNTVNLDFKLMAAEGVPVNQLSDLWEQNIWFPGLNRLRQLPAAATSQLSPEFEAIYRAGPLETRDTRLAMQWVHRLSRVWLDIPNEVAGTVTFSGRNISMARSTGIYVKLSSLRNDLSRTLSVESLLGNYERRPVENSWHPGSIVKKGAGLVWRNQAGIEWSLTPDLASGKLVTGTDCPYYSDYPDEQTNFTLEVANGKVIGFRFLGELYTRL